MDLQALMAQAKNMQNDMKENLSKMAIRARSGGGMVEVVINGHKELTQIEISDEALKDPEMLPDLILAAVNVAYAEVESRVKDQFMGSLGGLDLSAISNMFKGS
ncbi:MAG: nucleoid-associated protein, YbaB/EbfC family [Acidobacteria bacterium]|nr:MAG: nucleoid-associated protein, YbaB/EbfC family [Acidobacteriota bacterium]PIE89407.1 MAG: nucleoid-associated protein, YbaB/EbfC family [Acidobacteriota bacterium]